MAKTDTPDARLERWKRWWSVEDPYVRCAYCDAQQLIEQASAPFNNLHTASCALRSDLPQYPWLELRALLKTWQQHNPDGSAPV